MTFLADTFEKLANDPSWPSMANLHQESYHPAHLKTKMARLALMVVEKEMQTITEWTKEGPRPALTQTLQDLHINPSHYANVKKRVESK